MTRPPKWLLTILIILVTAAGWAAAQTIGSNPYQSTKTSTYTTHHVSTATRTRVVNHVVRGRIVILTGGARVVRIPAMVVRTAGHLVRIPAHDFPVRRVSSALTVARPAEPVTVTVTIPVPTTVTVTEPVTITETVTTTALSTITTTLPGVTQTETVTVESHGHHHHHHP